jgi:outer membrane biosynthesis protein TonB
MYFNFDDNHPDTPRIPSPLTRREVVLIAVNLHALVLIAILLGPRLPFVREIIELRQKAIDEQLRAELERQKERERDRARFVFVQPKLDVPAPKVSPRADLSDLDRRARTVERAERPTNPMPFSRGNSPERLEATPPSAPPQPTAAAEPPPTFSTAPPAPERPPDTPRPTERGPAVGVIADAIRNVRKYAQQDNFSNLRGGDDQNFSDTIQFDSKGVEFGPWVARFLAQVRSNWMIPQAAMSMHGHVAISLVVHKDGRITDVTVAKPSLVNAFTLSGRNAILTSNPTIPLPAEYPDDRMPILITFFFNEYPPGR